MHMSSTRSGSLLSALAHDFILRFSNDEKGATAIEYGLLCAMMALACITAFTAVGGSSSGAWSATANRVANTGK